MPSFTQTEEKTDATPAAVVNGELRQPLLGGGHGGPDVAGHPGPNGGYVPPNGPPNGPIGGGGGNDQVIGPFDRAANPHLNLIEIHPLLTEMMNEEWFREIYDLAELPTPYDFHSCRENMLSALALACALSASILYVLGGSKDGPLYVVGGVGVNLMQTFFFTKETISFFSKIHTQKQLAAISMFFALFSTTVTAFATFQMSDNNAALASIEALLVFAGNLPQNLYGMFESIKRVLDAHRDVPMAREHLLTELKNIVDGQPALQNSVPAPRGVINKMANTAVGYGVGVFLSLSQVGYIRSSVDFITTHTGNDIVGVVLGTLTNLPALCISMFISGQTLAEKIIDSTFDLGQWMLRKATGQPVPVSTAREMIFFGAKLGAGTIFAGFAHFSASTSRHLYYDSPAIPFFPSTAEFDAIIKVAIDQGCQIFNGVVAIMGSDQNIDFINKAYVEKPSVDEVKLKIKEMVRIINNSSDIDRIVNIAVQAGYQGPRVANAGCSFFRPGANNAAQHPANDQNGYRALQLEGEEPDHDANLVFGHH